MRIGLLIDFGLYRFRQLQDSQVNLFRRRMVRFRRGQLRGRHASTYLLGAETEPLPASLNASTNALNSCNAAPLADCKTMAFSPSSQSLSSTGSYSSLILKSVPPGPPWPGMHRGTRFLVRLAVLGAESHACLWKTLSCDLSDPPQKLIHSFFQKRSLPLNW